MLPQALLLIVCSAAVASAEWARFRGPNGSGVSNSTGLPVEFGRQKNRVWRTELPPGHSSPIVVDERIFLTGFTDDNLITLAVERKTGKILWRRELTRTRRANYHTLNGPASATPASDGRRVYVFFPEIGLVAYTMEGDKAWTRPLGPFSNQHGVASSPVLAGDMVIQQCDQNGGDSFLIAVDAGTGAVRWRVERRQTGQHPSFTTPVLYGERDVIVGGSFEWAAYSVETGEKRWWVAGMPAQPKASPIVSGRQVIISAPVFADGAPESAFSFSINHNLDLDGNGRISRGEAAAHQRLAKGFVNFDLDRDGEIDKSEWDRRMAAIRGKSTLIALESPSRGDVTESAISWRRERAVPNVPTPLLYEGVLYLLKEGGILTTLDATTGGILKQARLPAAPSAYFASPVAADGKVFAISEDGQVSVIEAGREWRPLYVSGLGESVYATPAIEGRSVYVRTAKALYRFDGAQ